MLGTAGCTNGCGHDRPYTPYAVDAGEHLFASDAAADAGPTAIQMPADAAVDAAPGRALAERPPTAATTRWTVAGLDLAAPDGERFVLALAADLDGDRQKDAAAWVVGADPAAGRLLFYKGDASGKVAEPKQLAALATGTMPAGCVAEPLLEHIGASTVAVTATAACVARPAPGTPSRWVAVASPAVDPPLRQQIEVGEPPPGEQLATSLDASDRDGDLRDDLVVRFTLEGGAPPFEPGPKVSAELRWFDRSAGLSRDADEPEASLRAAAAWQMTRAQRKKEAPSVPLATRQIVRLYEALCSDAGSPLVTLATGPLRCGASHALEDAIVAEVRAAATLGDPVRAVAAEERFAWFPSTTNASRRKDVERAIAKVAPAATAGGTRLLASVPEPPRLAGPSWSPLAFADDGALLVRTANGVVHATLAGQETTADGVEAWPLAVTSPDGAARWTDAFDPCDRLALRLRIDAGGTSHEPALPMLPPAPGRCPTRGSVEAVPLAWTGTRLEALVAGRPLALSSDLATVQPLDALVGAAAPRGSARSPDGSAIAIGTRFGALVGKGGKWRLWKPDGGSGAPLEGCTAANGGAAAACLRGGRVVVMTAPGK